MRLLFLGLLLVLALAQTDPSNNQEIGDQEALYDANAAKHSADVVIALLTHECVARNEGDRMVKVTIKGEDRCLGVKDFTDIQNLCLEKDLTATGPNRCKTCRYGQDPKSGLCLGLPRKPRQPNVLRRCGDGGCLNYAGICCEEQHCKDTCNKLLDDDGGDQSVGVTTGSNIVINPEDWKVQCGPQPHNGYLDNKYDKTGWDACNYILRYETGGTNVDMFCWKDRANGVYWQEGEYGTCDCDIGMTLSTTGECTEFTCVPSGGSGCKVCASPLTRNNECADCNYGYTLIDGDCLLNTCTEDVDDPNWQGCQECRPEESRRHPQDCLHCAHGYHFMHEQRNLPNQTTTDQIYGQVGETMVIPKQETGYCFPYDCVAGGNLMDTTPDDTYPLRYTHDFDSSQRSVKITAIVVTQHDSPDRDPNVPELSDEILAFRDHCKTCVPQQKRLKDDHCESCNPGYYLDEMHHTCRKKTCGVPHFRRIAVSCTEGTLEPLPWSTPCTECLDNSKECCVDNPPVMTCGAQGVFCHPGTQKAGYQTIDCSADGCVHYDSLCCNPMTCDNQQVSCEIGQIRRDGKTECTKCISGGSECCKAAPFTCGLKNVKCGYMQTYRGNDQTCEKCENEGTECCNPVQKTCQNQNVFCHPGTHYARDENGDAPVPCKDCLNYGDECCAPMTCLNQRVMCSPGREHRGDVECTDCIADTNECCKPLPPVPETCGNQLVKCPPNLYKSHKTACSTEEGTCNNYGPTCCNKKTCSNQGVGCMEFLQAPLSGETECTVCADFGNECCKDNKTCGLMGVQCKLGGYNPPDTECEDCNNFEAPCCTTVPKTCHNQGVICLPGTYKPMGTPCDGTGCEHYSSQCCNKKTCGNQQVSCSANRKRKPDDTECTVCSHDSDDCCDKAENTCANQNVKCMDGHYKDGQNTIKCGDQCINYEDKCCQVFKKTCGNQNVVCSADQTYAAPSKTCNSCLNHGDECCVDITKTCANQDVVCRPGYYEDRKTECGENCLNDAQPCCKEFKKTCGNQNVVCNSDQTYVLPSTPCTTCQNNGGECCDDKIKTCGNQRVACRPGHYAEDYANIECDNEGCLNDKGPCCDDYITTCGNQNTKCSKHQTPEDPDTPCDGEECNNNSSTCCIDVTATCLNQNIVCRPGHYDGNYRTTECGGPDKCTNGEAPCCTEFVKTCRNQNVQCRADQTYLGPDQECDDCLNYQAECCADVAHTCGNQHVICRPGYYIKDYKNTDCEETGCRHHSAPCCTTFEKTCGNQNVMCGCDQEPEKPTKVCDDCLNNGSECCTNVVPTCKNKGIVCRPGHYNDYYMTNDCPEGGCQNGAAPCCDDFQTTCGNQNVKCYGNTTPKNPDTACDGEECTNNSSKCCTPFDATCANQNVVCRPGYYHEDYAKQKCTDCLNDQEPCCKKFKKTCNNQNVVCGYGLMKHKQDMECTTCDNYDVKECCEPIAKTCGNSGQSCRQDLYLAADTPCTVCDASQCCEPIPDPPITCASEKHTCPAGHYKPGMRVCPTPERDDEKACNDDICCNKVITTCGNQNIQCHVGLYKPHDTLCDDKCVHYGSQCCHPQTCKSAGVSCDPRYFQENTDDFDNGEICDAFEGDCVLKSDTAPCCEPKASQRQAPTCLNKYGIDSEDLKDWPFLYSWEGLKEVSCNPAEGYYPRVQYTEDSSGELIVSREDNACAADSSQSNGWSACQTNDLNCCWRKTCKINNNEQSNGFYNGGEGIKQGFEDISCPEGYTEKPNGEYIVCQGDCIADCCDKIPEPDTCQSARVACTQGYERLAKWDENLCGNDCVENSSKCCQRTKCTQVTCDQETQIHQGSAVCWDCLNNGPECCKPKPVVDTCKNQRVHCGYGYFKHGDYDDKTCTECYDDGSECCVRKTCAVRGPNLDAVVCHEDKTVDRYEDMNVPCWTCVDDGAECCTPIVPTKTCGNQKVECGIGMVHKALSTECEECLDHGSECCTQRTCGDTGSGYPATCDSNKDLTPKAGTTKCMYCNNDGSECCSKQETCWSMKITCPEDKYHKHPELPCAQIGGCTTETCCAEKTCVNQGVCCNENLGFTKAEGFNDARCTSCADNCEECCTFKTPTCKSAGVGCGFGYHRKKDVDNTPCDTCALNDAKCCEPRTCGADNGIDEKYTCPDDYDYLGDSTKCHFCGKAECCKPSKPTKTCASERVSCGSGLEPVENMQNIPCSTCVQNDPKCCVHTTCADHMDCPDGFTNKGEVLCSTCTLDECCNEVQTCKSARVGCGFGFRHIKDSDNVECESCALNDGKCCEALTCENSNFVCPKGFKDVSNQEKSCSFCELSECCEPVEPAATCKSTPVSCGYGFTRKEGSDDTPCGMCEMNSGFCCTANKCTSCPKGFHRKETVTDCGFCNVEECCEANTPDKTCANQKVACGFGYNYKDKLDQLECTKCHQNDAACCQQRTCGNSGPDCSELMKGDHPYTSNGLETLCTTCSAEQCCVAPIIQKTCLSERVACTSGYMKDAKYMDGKDCDDCLPNGDECCVPQTCQNMEVYCNPDYNVKVPSYDNTHCLVCASNGAECCMPKMCGDEFFANDGFCNVETHTSKAVNTPCVACDQSECCEPKPTLKCAEIIIPHGQAFYSEPAGPGTARTKGSILRVECDLGYKFQDSEYLHSSDVQNRDQSPDVDYPVCDPLLIESWIEGHVEIFSPTTSGWDRAPPVCRPVTCPLLEVHSIFTPDAPTKWNIGRVVYRDAQMDTVPMRGAGYGPRDYAAEADVVCNEGWIRVPNICADTNAEHKTDSQNTLEWGLKGFWRFEDGKTEDMSPHCLDSRGSEKSGMGSCNDGHWVGDAKWINDGGMKVDGVSSDAITFDGKTNYLEIHDTYNPNWDYWHPNELDLDENQWTASLFVKVNSKTVERDGYLFSRYNSKYKTVVGILLRDLRPAVVYNDEPESPSSADRIPMDEWVSILVRMDGEKIELFVNGVLKGTKTTSAKIADTKEGHLYVGADREFSDDPDDKRMNNFFPGVIDEVRYYTRGLTDQEVICITNGRMTCPEGKFYAKPYNTQGCNRASEEILTYEECQEAVNELLQDNVLGNSLNGGKRFGRVIEDEQSMAGNDVPAKCSYREEDAQLMFNPAANGRAHTSLAPICKQTPSEPDLHTIGCLPKCLENGKWNVALPSCEKDWCHPMFEEWSCCRHRTKEMDQEYYKAFHKQSQPACPIGYGDCDNDAECLREENIFGYCSQQRDLDNIDVCITDLDPCGGVKGATGTLCVVMTAVGMDYHSHAEAGTLHRNLFFGGAILAFGTLAGYYYTTRRKGEEYRHLLEEEI